MSGYIFVPAGRKVWVGLARLLRDRYGLSPVMWIGDDVHLEDARAQFQSAEIYRFTDTNKGSFEARITVDGLRLLQSMAGPYCAIKLQVLDMMNRQDLHGSFTFQARSELCDRLMLHFLSRIIELKPRFLLCSESPHSPATFLLYKACEWVGVPCLMFQGNLIFPSLLFREGIDGRFVDLSGIAQGVELQALLARLDQYVERVSVKAYQDGQPEYVKVQKASNRRPMPRLRLWSKALPHLRPKKYNRPNYFLKDCNKGQCQSVNGFEAYIEQNHPDRKIALYKIFEQFVNQQIDLNGPFVYFPLHFQPERTTNPDGGEYYNQLDVLRRLRSRLPGSTAIYVKEHFSQFSYNFTGHLGRTEMFYRGIVELENTHLISMSLDSFTLIDKSLATATITGTVGVEAVLRGKPAFVLGHPWYEGMPGTFALDAAAQAIESGQSYAQQAGEFLRDRVRNSVPGIINPSGLRYFTPKDDMSEEVGYLMRAFERWFQHQPETASDIRVM